MMTPSTTDAGDTEAGSGLTALISRVSPIPATMPNAAPTVARAADSARNWRSTSRRRAPSDFRRPISRVRSATDISMMFMITMPPITSDTITTPGRTTTRMRLIPDQNRCTPSDVSSTKLLSWLGRRWRRLRMTPSATSMASRISTSERAFTRRASTTPGGFTRLWAGAKAGTTTKRSSGNPRTLPCFSTTTNSRLATASPRTATGTPERFSWAVKGRPMAIRRFLISKYRSLAATSWMSRASLPVEDGAVIVRLPGRDDGHGQGRGHRLRVAELDAGAAPPRAPHGVGHVRREHRPAPQLKCVHPVQRLGELLGHVAVHAVHDRPRGDERGDADEHSEQREAALQFLCADGLEGEPERFEDRHLGGLALIRGDQSVP